MNGIREGSSITPKVWLNDSMGELKNPLTINGRLLTHNTRGGSLISDGVTLKKADTNGICVMSTGPVLDSSICSDLARAGSQDLERFRVVTKTPDDNRCTLHATGVTAENRPDILTQVNF